jgi:hypothetical protein
MACGTEIVMHGIRQGRPLGVLQGLGYQLEDWFSLYQSALVELEEAKMSGRIEAAHTAIVARIEKLVTLPAS